MISLYLDDQVKIPQIKRNIIKKWIEEIVSIHGKRLGEITYRFCNDETILQYNREFLSHDYYTDIITFDDCQGDVISGDLLISVDTVKSNAESLSVKYIDEFYRVLIHGVLHLIGFGDKTDEEALMMRKKENEALTILYSMLSK